MSLFKKDKFGHILIIKKILIIIIGIFSYKKFFGEKKIKIDGTDNIPNKKLKNVLFISNHQTYFLDAIGIIHVLNSTINGNKNNLKILSYLLKPKLNTYYVAAKETMNSGIIPKILSYTGAILIERTWRENGKKIKRAVNNNDIININKALKEGWLITFPQGTTSNSGKVRKGTSHIILNNQPLVIPIVINGFADKFEKKSLSIKNPDKETSIIFKKPLKINYKKDSIDDITLKIKKSLEL